MDHLTNFQDPTIIGPLKSAYYKKNKTLKNLAEVQSKWTVRYGSSYFDSCLFLLYLFTLILIQSFKLLSLNMLD